MHAWQAWQAYVRVVINDPTYSDASAQYSYSALLSPESEAWAAVATAATTNDFGITDQAILNIGIGTESGHGTADVTFTVSDDAITNIYIDNLVVDPEQRVSLL